MLTGGTQKVICSGDDRSCTANESKQTIETLSKIAIQFSYSRDDITALPPSTPSHYIEKSCEEGLRCPTVARGAWMRRLIPGEERHQGRRDEQCQAAYHLHGPIVHRRHCVCGAVVVVAEYALQKQQAENENGHRLIHDEVVLSLLTEQTSECDCKLFPFAGSGEFVGCVWCVW